MKKRQKQKGFNLIEAAIVLGVIGLVIGGIWIAASSVSYKYGLSQTASGIQMSIETIRQLYKNMPCDADVGINPKTINLGLASQWPAGDSGTYGPGATNTPLENGIIRYIIECSANPVIHVAFYNIDYSYCINFATSARIPNPYGSMHDNGDFKEMGGAGRCEDPMSMISMYWYLKPR